MVVEMVAEKAEKMVAEKAEKMVEWTAGMTGYELAEMRAAE